MLFLIGIVMKATMFPLCPSIAHTCDTDHHQLLVLVNVELFSKIFWVVWHCVGKSLYDDNGDVQDLPSVTTGQLSAGKLWFLEMQVNQSSFADHTRDQPIIRIWNYGWLPVVFRLYTHVAYEPPKEYACNSGAIEIQIHARKWVWLSVYV